MTGCKTRNELEELLADKAEGITFVSGKGKHKTEQQREWEAIDHLCQQWRKYEEQLTIMGEDRNSYSKTDHDATFMRMKEDHMRNGQLKPAYNMLQINHRLFFCPLDTTENCHRKQKEDCYFVARIVSRSSFVAITCGSVVTMDWVNV